MLWYLDIARLTVVLTTSATRLRGVATKIVTATTSAVRTWCLGIAGAGRKVSLVERIICQSWVQACRSRVRSCSISLGTASNTNAIVVASKEFGVTILSVGS